MSTLQFVSAGTQTLQLVYAYVCDILDDGISLFGCLDGIVNFSTMPPLGGFRGAALLPCFAAFGVCTCY